MLKKNIPIVRPFRRGSAVGILLAAASLGVIGFAGWYSVARLSPLAGVSIPVSEREACAALARAGVTPTIMAACGVTGPQASEIINDAAGYLTEHGAAFNEAMSNLQNRATTADRLTQSVQSGNTADAAALASALSQRGSAQSARDAAQAAFLTAAFADLSEGQRSKITTAMTNRRPGVPVQYWTENRTDAQWLQLREALTNQRQAGEGRVASNTSCQSIVAAADASQTVSTAAQSLNTNLAGVTQAWTTAE